MRIGRHELCAGDVSAITPRGWLRALFAPGFDVYLRSGVRLHFTPEEKAAFEQECGIEVLSRQLYDAARATGLRDFA